jgi:hypothetical protein
MTQFKLAQKLQALHALKNYLFVLSELTQREVKKSDLISLEETIEITQRAKPIRESPVRRFEIDFNAKNTGRFKAFIGNLAKAKPQPVYVWSDGASVCGYFQVSSLLEIDFGFAYKIDVNGVFVFMSQDLKDELLIDFYENQTGERRLIVEVYGQVWPTIEY